MTRRRRGFTLLETSLATVIIGVGVLAIMEAQQSFLRSNNWSSQAAAGTYLANEIREMTRKLPRHDSVTGLFTMDEGEGDVLIGWGTEDGEVLVEDFDDIDDFDGITFGAGADLPGPINAFGELIPEINADGDVVLDDEDQPLAMQGWSQEVIVEKVDPFDFATVHDADYAEPPAGDFAGRAVDQFPLRVTVVVWYQGPLDAESSEVVRVSWIVPD